MSSASLVDKNTLLQVTPDEVEYFRKFKPLHYIALNEMLKHGEAEVVKESAGG